MPAQDQLIFTLNKSTPIFRARGRNNFQVARSELLWEGEA